MSEELKANLLKRLKSLGWRTLCFVVVGLVSVVLDNLASVQLPPLVVAMIGLSLGEVTKYFNNHTDLFGAKLK